MKTKTRTKTIFLLLIILLVPILLLFGCDELATFRIDAYVNENKNGTVYGYGTYTEGDTVTLTANGLNGNRFIAWVYQNKTLITNNSVYTISTSEDGLSSTLTFSASMATADRYTAVFEDNSQQYYTLSSYKFTTDLNAEDALPEETTDLLVSGGSINVMIGETITNFRNLTLIEGDFRDRVRTDVSGVTEVLNLSYTTPYYIRFNFSYTNSQPVVRTITATLGTNSSSNGVNLVFNQDNSFDIQYTFQISTMEDEEEVVRDVTLVLTFSPLAYVSETTVA